MSQAVRANSTTAPAFGRPSSNNVNRARYLEPSPVAADGGQQVGKMPGSIVRDDLGALGHPESPIRAIRAKCIDCSGGAATEARKCVAIGCALWPFRMASNPFRKPASEAKRASTANATAAARTARAGLEARFNRPSIELAHPAATIPHAATGNAKTVRSEGQS